MACEQHGNGSTVQRRQLGSRKTSPLPCDEEDGLDVTPSPTRRPLCSRSRVALKEQAVLRCWRRVVVFANLWGKAKVLKFFAPSHFGAFTQSSLVLKFFAARRRELRLQRLR